VLARLPQEAQFRGRVVIDEVSWDNPAAPVPLAAQLTPQEAINQGLLKPADCDVVLVILWARMGTPLPPEYVKTGNVRFESGTEWEYLNAIEAAERRGTPHVLVYRRTERVLLDPDAADFAERSDQRQRVHRFFAGFRDPDGSLRRSYHEYLAPADFEDLLERQLRELLWRQLEGTDPPTPEDPPVAADPLWQDAPYPGLRAFTWLEAPIFFGRGRETDDLVGRFTSGNARFLAVIGASGSGKSSLVAAGLLPRLAAGAAQGQPWTWVRCTPGYAGGNPFLALAVQLDHAFPKPGWRPADLARRFESAGRETLVEVVNEALADRPPPAELVLFIDQLEELFMPPAEQYRKAFVDLIAAAADIRRLRTVVTLRADFYAHCTQWQPLVRLLRDSGSYPLGLPGPQALAEMITRPATAAGLQFDDGLVDRILQDTGTGPGALALMEFMLSKLHERRAGTRLTTATYDELKGVAGVIEERAEAAVREANGSIDESAVAALFRALVTVDPRTGSPVRRRATLADLGDIRPLVDRLVAARLLIAGQGDARDGAVEVAHEAVLEHWTRLVRWVEEHRGLILWQRRMEDDVADWKRAPDDSGTLLRGSRLAEGERWLATGAGQLSADETAFVQASVAARNRERAARRRRSIGEAVVAAGLLVSVGAFALALLGGGLVRPGSHEVDDLRADAERTLARFKETDPVIAQLLESAAGYAVFRRIGKLGLIVGGARGSGLVYQRGTLVGLAHIWQFTVGAQAGLQVYSELILFQDDATLERFKQSPLDMGAHTSAVVAGEGATSADYRQGVLTFALPVQGLMAAEVSVGGQTITFMPPPDPPPSPPVMGRGG